MRMRTLGIRFLFTITKRDLYLVISKVYLNWRRGIWENFK
jgi:hypothetical protein